MRDEMVGRSVRCKSCSEVFVVSIDGAPATPSSPKPVLQEAQPQPPTPDAAAQSAGENVNAAAVPALDKLQSAIDSIASAFVDPDAASPPPASTTPTTRSVPKPQTREPDRQSAVKKVAEAAGPKNVVRRRKPGPSKSDQPLPQAAQQVQPPENSQPASEPSAEFREQLETPPAAKPETIAGPDASPPQVTATAPNEVVEQTQEPAAPVERQINDDADLALTVPEVSTSDLTAPDVSAPAVEPQKKEAPEEAAADSGVSIGTQVPQRDEPETQPLAPQLDSTSESKTEQHEATAAPSDDTAIPLEEGDPDEEDVLFSRSGRRISRTKLNELSKKNRLRKMVGVPLVSALLLIIAFAGYFTVKYLLRVADQRPEVATDFSFDVEEQLNKLLDEEEQRRVNEAVSKLTAKSGELADLLQSITDQESSEQAAEQLDVLTSELSGALLEKARIIESAGFPKTDTELLAQNYNPSTELATIGEEVTRVTDIKSTLPALHHTLFRLTDMVPVDQSVRWKLTGVTYSVVATRLSDCAFDLIESLDGLRKEPSLNDDHWKAAESNLRPIVREAYDLWLYVGELGPPPSAIAKIILQKREELSKAIAAATVPMPASSLKIASDLKAAQALLVEVFTTLRKTATAATDSPSGWETPTSAIDVSQYEGPGPVEPSGLEIDFGGLLPGMVVLVQRSAQWYAADVLEVLPDGTVKVHYRGWSFEFDEIVSTDRMQSLRPGFGSGVISRDQSNEDRR